MYSRLGPLSGRIWKRVVGQVKFIYSYAERRWLIGAQGCFNPGD